MTIMDKAKRIVPGLAGLVTFLFTPPAQGWSTVARNIELNQMDMALQSAVASISGVRLGGIGGQANTEIPVGAVLNPLNLTEAPTPKVVLWTRTILEIADVVQGSISKYIKELF